MDQDKLIFTGIIVAAHGIKGDGIVKSFTENPINICSLKLKNKNNEEFKLKFIKQTNKNLLICKINDFSTRCEVERVIKTNLYCYACDLPKLEADEFYIRDLKNLNVVDKNMNPIGKILDLYNFGAGDIAEISFNDGSTELFPFRSEYFGSITKEYIIFLIAR